MTAQGHPRAIFKRAIERGNVVVAEAMARELGHLTLDEALQLVFLYAEKEPIKYEKAALRWHVRYESGCGDLDGAPLRKRELKRWSARDQLSGAVRRSAFSSG